jgi:hypothetical protein
MLLSAVCLANGVEFMITEASIEDSISFLLGNKYQNSKSGIIIQKLLLLCYEHGAGYP